MDLLKRLNESTMVCLWVLDGVGMNLRPLDRMDFNGFSNWIVGDRLGHTGYRGGVHDGYFGIVGDRLGHTGCRGGVRGGYFGIVGDRLRHSGCRGGVHDGYFGIVGDRLGHTVW